METVAIILVALAVFVLLFSLLLRQRRQKLTVPPMPGHLRDILSHDVPFYNALDEPGKMKFESRMMHFLTTTRITGVKTSVEESDKVYIAASAIIPIFGFDDWEYINVNEVLLYPDFFNDDFDQKGKNRDVLGMVGDGALNNTMILSRRELRAAFQNKTGKTNTAIHEFVHLVDKTDGSVDGIPEFFLDKQFVLPWLQLIQKGIKDIINEQSDINPYGATNEAEFFAVVSEYFFERPDLLQNNHPELYDLLSKVFRQKPGKTDKSRQ